MDIPPVPPPSIPPLPPHPVSLAGSLALSLCRRRSHSRHWGAGSGSSGSTACKISPLMKTRTMTQTMFQMKARVKARMKKPWMGSGGRKRRRRRRRRCIGQRRRRSRIGSGPASVGSGPVRRAPSAACAAGSATPPHARPAPPRPAREAETGTGMGGRGGRGRRWRGGRGLVGGTLYFMGAARARPSAPPARGVYAPARPTWRRHAPSPTHARALCARTHTCTHHPTAP
jgi:hypothetical protein